MPMARQSQSWTPEPRSLTPVAMMISSRAGRIFSTAFTDTVVGRALRRPFSLVPSAWTGTMSPFARERNRWTA